MTPCFYGIDISCRVRESGISQTQLVRMFRIPQPAVGIAVSRGEQMAKDRNFSLIDE